MTTNPDTTPCETCRDIPPRAEGEEKIASFRKILTVVKEGGHYYRGEEMQLTRLSLLQCPTCGTYFEDAHHYYSDPQSTMGLARDEDDWYVLERLSAKAARERLG